MNVVLEEQPNCEVVVRVEVPMERVDREWKSVTREFQQHAKLPGFRPGKTPPQLIESKYSREIREETMNKLLQATLREAIGEKKLRVLFVAGVEGPDLGADRTMRYAATVVIEPEFELPDYENLEIAVAEPVVDEARIEETMDRLREGHADFEAVEDRALAMGDYGVISYATSLEGRPLREAMPDLPPLLLGRENFWFELKENAFLPGFAGNLVGLSPEGEKEFPLILPEDFPVEAMRGKTLDFRVTLHEIKRKVLPEWSDELAGKVLEGKTVVELRETVAENMKRAAEEEYEAEKRRLALAALRTKVNCTLPTRLVNQEMSSLMKNIVEENLERGIAEEELMGHEEEIRGAARQGAEERVRGRFLLLRLAEKENLRVSEQELLAELIGLSQRYNMPPKKLMADIKKRDALPSVKENILVNKAIAFLAGKVKVVPPSAGAA